MKKAKRSYVFLSQKQCEVLILGSLAVTPDGLSEESLASVCEWADGVLFDHAMLENALQAHLGVVIKDGKPVFQLLPKGTIAAERLIAGGAREL